MIIKEVFDKNEKANIVRDILSDLPEWFGKPESVEDYIVDSQEMPFIVCFDGDEAVGFVALNSTSKDCADLFVMGIKRRYHRKGIGTKINEAYEKLAKEKGFTYSQVKL